MENTKLEWSTNLIKVKELIPNEKNPRNITKEQLENLKNSLEKFNLVELVVCNLDNSLLVGHQRVQMLIQLGRQDELIEARMPNRKLTQEEADQYMLISNRVHGEFDAEKLFEYFDIDLALSSGFDSTDIAKIWDERMKVEDADLEETEIENKEIQTQPGDLIILGSHKLICGSSEDPHILKKLFDGEEASMILSDPPYNINLNYAKGIGGNRDFGGNVNDNRSEEEYKAFIRRTMLAALSVSKQDLHAMYYCDQARIYIIQQLFIDLGLTNKRVFIWAKGSANPVPGTACGKSYEPAPYSTRGNPYISKSFQDLNEFVNNEFGSGNQVLENIDDLFDILPHKRLPVNEYIHTTAKPPVVHEKIMKKCTKINDIILDSFAGSGSTIFAAESLKRRVFAVELEPQFCDAIIRKYEKVTGVKAAVIRN